MSDRGARPSSAKSGQLSQLWSARLGLTTYDFQLRKVITPSSELRFGCSCLYGKPIESRFHSYA